MSWWAPIFLARIGPRSKGTIQTGPFLPEVIKFEPSIKQPWTMRIHTKNQAPLIPQLNEVTALEEDARKSEISISKKDTI
jgi:hypothetical protein